MSIPSTGGARVNVSVAEPTTTTGGSLTAHVTVAGELDEKVRGLRVELLYVNEYRYKRRQDGDGRNRRTTGSDTVDFFVGDSGNGNTTIDVREEDVVVQTITFPVADGPLTGARDVELWVPEDAPPTSGQLVRWKVRAVVDRAKGRDVHGEARVVVHSSPARGTARTAAEPDVDEQLELVLSERIVRPGDTLTGTLVVAPKKTTKFTDIRVEIQAHRSDQDGISDTDTICAVALSGKTQVDGGERQELPFELDVPVDAMPSFVASNNEIRHTFVASGARRLRLDYNASATLHVYTAADGD